MTTIHVRHARAVGDGYCSKGMRLFAEKHKLDWDNFVKFGISVESVSHIDDEMLRRVIVIAEADENERRGR